MSIPPEKIKSIEDYIICSNKEAIKPVICILGANGQLGREFLAYLNAIDYKNFVGFDSSLDISDKISIKKLKAVPCEDCNVRRFPDIIINCAAYNNVYGPETQDLEKRKEEKEKCFRSNALGPKYLAEFCKKRKIKLIHFSTNYVFEDNSFTMKKYTEFDEVKPFLFYGFSKLCGEKFIQERLASSSIIIRTSWLFSKEGSLVKIIKKHAEEDKILTITNAVGNPTNTLDLVKQTLFLIEHKASGLYHCVNGGTTTKKQYVDKVIELLGLNVKTGTLGSGPSMPLDNFMLDMEDINIMRPWEDSAEQCFRE